jgi:hypothetical protein
LGEFSGMGGKQRRFTRTGDEGALGLAGRI